MLPFRLQREFPTPSLALFVALQMLDILTTVIGLHLGAGESSTFIGRLMHVDPMAALLVAKLFAAPWWRSRSRCGVPGRWCSSTFGSSGSSAGTWR